MISLRYHLVSIVAVFLALALGVVVGTTVVNQGIVDETPRPSDDNPRRRYYRLTALGRGILAAEVTRLDGVVREAKLHLRLAKPRRA